MGIRKITQLFRDGSVCVCGLRGRGKDMLMSNVVIRRRKPYIGNTNYGGHFIPFDYNAIAVAGNTYENFLRGDVKKYVYPYADGTDFYLGDLGVYFPAQYCNELNRSYKQMPVFQALLRHLGDANFHYNVQNLNRVWDKIREQSDTFLMCNWCKVFFGKIVIQKVTQYELYDPAVKRVPPFRLPKPLFNAERRFQWKVQQQNYMIAHGEIKSHLLIYINKSSYNTRFFKEVLENGIEKDSA